MGPPHEGSIRQPIAPWANALPLSYIPLPPKHEGSIWRPIAPWANALPLSYVPLPPTHEGSIRRPIAPWANALTTELKNPSSYIGCLVSGYKVLVAQWVQPMKDRSDDPWANAFTTELQSGCVTFECAMMAWWSSEWWSASYRTEWMRYLWVRDDGLVAGGHLSDGVRDIAQWVAHEGSIRRPIAPWANALPLSYVPLPPTHEGSIRWPIAPWANALTTELNTKQSESLLWLPCIWLQGPHRSMGPPWRIDPLTTDINKKESESVPWLPCIWPQGRRRCQTGRRTWPAVPWLCPSSPTAPRSNPAGAAARWRTAPWRRPAGRPWTTRGQTAPGGAAASGGGRGSLDRCSFPAGLWPSGWPRWAPRQSMGLLPVVID